MSEDTTLKPETDESTSNLRAIFEILSYIHVDAQEGSFNELSERIGFALDCAEKLIKQKAGAASSAGPGPQVSGTAARVEQVIKPQMVT